MDLAVDSVRFHGGDCKARSVNCKTRDAPRPFDWPCEVTVKWGNQEAILSTSVKPARC